MEHYQVVRALHLKTGVHVFTTQRCFAIVATIPPVTKQPVRVPGYAVVK